MRRSEWGHCRSIRCLVWIKIETRQDEAFSTGWSTPWSRGSVGLSDGRVEANRDDLVAGSSVPDNPMDCRCIPSEQLCQRIAMAMWRGRGTGWTDALENLASVHATLTFSVVVSQQLVWCLGLFIPLHPPIWSCWNVWKCRGVQDTLKTISNPSKC
jgi:hypothetical protein